jgi:polyphosphate kinase 2 (PPK2 family)
MPWRMSELKRDALAMPACGETSAFDRRHFMRHIGVNRVMPDRVDARFRTISPGLYSCTISVIPK